MDIQTSSIDFQTKEHIISELGTRAETIAYNAGTHAGRCHKEDVTVRWRKSYKIRSLSEIFLAVSMQAAGVLINRAAFFVVQSGGQRMRRHFLHPNILSLYSCCRQLHLLIHVRINIFGELVVVRLLLGQPIWVT